MMPENSQMVANTVPTSASEVLPPERVRMDVTKLGRWIRDCTEDTLRSRAPIELDWIKIKWILSGFHYFIVDPLTGTVLHDYGAEEANADQDIRAYTNLMLNRYKRELGRRNTVSLAINPAALNFTDPDAVKHEKRARLGLADWQEKENFYATFDEFNQMVLRMGLAAFLPEPSWDGKTAKVWAIPGADLFPLPSTNASMVNGQGIAYRKFLAEAWLEQSVSEGKLHPDVLTQIGKHVMEDRISSPFLGGTTVGYHKPEIKGAIGYFFYLYPSREYPEGLHGLEIGDKIYAIHINQKTGNPGLPIGGPPIPVWDTKIDCDWYPQSFCAPLIGLNLEDDRQLSNEIAMSEVARHGGWTIAPENLFSRNDFSQTFGGLVTYKTNELGMDNKLPIENIAPPVMRGETSIVGNRIAREADETASHYAVNRGEAPGRIEGDPAVQRLLAQTDLPNEPYLNRLRWALIEVHRKVLDIMAVTWTADKWISVMGPFDRPQQMRVLKGEMPSTEHVRLTMGPLVPGSRLETIGMLNMLRKNQDIDTYEYRRGLSANGFTPRGIELEDPEMQFAMEKVLWIYNDGVRPRPWPAGDDFDLEPHAKVVEVIRKFTNTLDFKLTTQLPVKQALRAAQVQHALKLGNELTRLRAQVQFEEDDLGRFERNLGADEDSLVPGNPLMAAF